MCDYTTWQQPGRTQNDTTTGVNTTQQPSSTGNVDYHLKLVESQLVESEPFESHRDKEALDEQHRLVGADERVDEVGD